MSEERRFALKFCIFVAALSFILVAVFHTARKAADRTTGDIALEGSANDY